MGSSPVHEAEQAEEIAPDRLRVELVHRFQRLVEQAIAHEVTPLGERDEENSVEDFLRRLDRLAERKLPAISGMLEKVDQPFSQIMIIFVEPVGDVLVGAVRLAQEPFSRFAEKISCAKNQPQPTKFARIIEPFEVEAFICLAPAPIAVEFDFTAVRHQHPFGAWRVVSVFPGLLHWRLGASGHDPVEVLGVRAFQLERRDDRHLASDLEIPERGVNRPRCKRLLVGKRVGLVRINARIAEDLDEDLVDKDGAKGLLLSGGEAAHSTSIVASQFCHRVVRRSGPTDRLFDDLRCK